MQVFILDTVKRAHIFVLEQAKRDKKELLTFAVYTWAFFTIPLVICSLVVSSTANAGFNIVLTAFLNAFFCVGAYYVVNNSRTTIAIGFLLGSSATMTILNLLTAIYWGELSKCQSYPVLIPHYSCSQTSAYSAVFAFSLIIFFIELAFTVGVYLWRNDLISETGVYERVSTLSVAERVEV